MPGRSRHSKVRFLVYFVLNAVLFCNFMHSGALAGPPQSTPLEDVPQHPYPETQVVGKRTKGPNSPASPHLPAAPHDTADCHQQEQLEGTTARFATLKTDELNSPTYHTWSSERSSGHPVAAQDLKAVQPVDESGLVGGAKEVALLRRDVRKVVKQEMRAIVRELIKVSSVRMRLKFKRHSPQCSLY